MTEQSKAPATATSLRQLATREGVEINERCRKIYEEMTDRLADRLKKWNEREDK